MAIRKCSTCAHEFKHIDEPPCNACFSYPVGALPKWEAAEAAEAAPPAPDAVNPEHYRLFPVEVIQLTRHLNFNRGNAVKYLCRAGAKDDEVQDLKKARWYIDDEIQRVTGEGEHAKP